jgi:hypothetical protein
MRRLSSTASHEQTASRVRRYVSSLPNCTQTEWGLLTLVSDCIQYLCRETILQFCDVLAEYRNERTVVPVAIATDKKLVFPDVTNQQVTVQRMAIDGLFTVHTKTLEPCIWTRKVFHLQKETASRTRMEFQIEEESTTRYR